MELAKKKINIAMGLMSAVAGIALALAATVAAPVLLVAGIVLAIGAIILAIWDPQIKPIQTVIKNFPTTERDII